MSLASYSDLQTTALAWMERTGVDTAQAPDWITLAEARLNRELGPLETESTLTGTADSRVIDISGLTIVKPIGLWLTPATGQDERQLQEQSSSDLPFRANSGQPAMWAMHNDTEIRLDCPCLSAYSFRFRYRGRFALSDMSDTNWLLEQHPDIYLAAVMMWGAGYNQEWTNGQVWKSLLDEELPKVRNLINRRNRGTLRVDPALSGIGGGGYNIWTDS